MKICARARVTEGESVLAVARRKGASTTSAVGIVSITDLVRLMAGEGPARERAAFTAWGADPAAKHGIFPTPAP